MNFKEQLEAKRRATQGRHQSHDRDLSSLSEAELDVEVRRAEQRVREAKEREVIASREVTAAPSKSLFPRKTKRPWK